MSNYRISIKRFNLDTATNDKVVYEFGNQIQIVESSSESAIISVTPLGEKLTTEGRLPLQNRDYVRVPDPFNRVAMTWDAQPGQWVDVMFMTQDPTPEEFEYIRQQRGTIDNIANEVGVYPSQGNALKMKRINVGATALKICDANTKRRSLIIFNESNSADLIIGFSNTVGPASLVDASAISSRCSVVLDKACTGEIWGSLTSGNGLVSVTEEGVQ